MDKNVNREERKRDNSECRKQILAPIYIQSYPEHKVESGTIQGQKNEMKKSLCSQKTANDFKTMETKGDEAS